MRRNWFRAAALSLVMIGSGGAAACVTGDDGIFSRAAADKALLWAENSFRGALATVDALDALGLIDDDIRPDLAERIRRADRALDLARAARDSSATQGAALALAAVTEIIAAIKSR